MEKPSSHTIRVGLIGAGIQASRSPYLHESEARAAGFALCYELIDMEQRGVGVEALPDLLAEAQAQGFTGVNITHPCKQAVLPLLDELSDAAATITAVNTVVFSSGKRIGYNTDAWGFAENFRRRLGDVRRENVVLLGAGGAGSAVAHAALQLGVQQLAVFDEDRSRATSLADRLRRHFEAQRVIVGTDLAAAMTQADGLIHATPVGMLGYPGVPLPIEWLRPALWVTEIVYFPLETELLKGARQRGCRTLDGGGMAVFQAAEAFRLFTGVTPDYERMLRSFVSLNQYES